MVLLNLLINLRRVECLFDESGLFTDNNETGTPLVKSENKNTPETVESTCCYHLRKTDPPPYLVDYVTKSQYEDLVNHVNFCYALNVSSSFEQAMERDENLNWKYAIEEEIKSLEKKLYILCYEITRGQKISGRKIGLRNEW